jgi:hypothetical protein
VSTANDIRSARSVETVVDRLATCPAPLAISRGAVWDRAHDLAHMSHVVWRRWLRAHGRTVDVRPRAACAPGPKLGADVHVCGACPAAPRSP